MTSLQIVHTYIQEELLKWHEQTPRCGPSNPWHHGRVGDWRNQQSAEWNDLGHHVGEARADAAHNISLRRNQRFNMANDGQNLSRRARPSWSLIKTSYGRKEWAGKPQRRTSDSACRTRKIFFGSTR